jgi:alkaline phosphatase
MRKSALAAPIFPLIASMLMITPPAHAAGVRNLILCIGDGMSGSAITGGRILAGQRAGMSNPAEGHLFIDSLPATAFLETYALDQLVTDSAAGITALVTGEKTQVGRLGIVTFEDGSIRKLRTILEMAEEQGRSTGVVSTTRITHATPAGCYSHELDRNEESAIALQLLPGDPGYNHDLGNGLEVVLGGGRRAFFPKDGGWLDEEGAGGSRTDGRDLRVDFRRAGYAYVWNREEMLLLDVGRTDRLLGLFDSSHMAYDSERSLDTGGEPSLSEMAEVAVRMLSKNPKGFFLMVEGGRIDHALHERHDVRAFEEVIAFDDAVRAVAALVDPEETLLIVTADHSHALSMVEDAPDSLGPEAFGGGERVHSIDAVALGDHDATDVPSYAWGVKRYTERLHGTRLNTAVFELLLEALEGR